MYFEEVSRSAKEWLARVCQSFLCFLAFLISSASLEDATLLKGFGSASLKPTNSYILW